MEGPRTPRPDEKETLIDFLDQHLRSSQSWSIQDEYPTTFTDKNLHNLHIVEKENAVLSHAATRYVLLKTPQAVFKVAAIGSVVTSADHRRQGFSHQLLQACVEKAQEQSADIAILWTDLFDFYRKLGFELAGREVSFMIDQPIKDSTPNVVIREGANISPEALLRVFNKHTTTSVRSAEDVRKYLKIPNSRVYTAWDQKGFLQAYAIEGKGADLNGYIHEWGGGVSQLIPLFNHIQESQERPITLITPAHAHSLIRTLKERGVPHHDGHLGMVKILNTESVKNKVLRYARSMGVAGLSFNNDVEKPVMMIGDEAIHFSDSRQLTQFLFGPTTKEVTAKLSNHSQEILDQLFPMHLWVWGWDSI